MSLEVKVAINTSADLFQFGVCRACGVTIAADAGWVSAVDGIWQSPQSLHAKSHGFFS